MKGAVAGDHKKPATTIPGDDTDPRTRSTGTSPRPRRTPGGSPTSPTCQPGSGSCTSRSCWTCTRAHRRLAGSSSLRTDLALDALEQGIWPRQRKGTPARAGPPQRQRSQYLSIRYTERLEEPGIVASVGSVGDFYDNAAAEALNRLFKTELIRRLGPWRSLEHVEFEVLKWVDWYNQGRLHSWCATPHPPSTKTPTTLPNPFPDDRRGRTPDSPLNPGRFIINALLSAQAEAVCGAEYGTRSEDRINRRNGFGPAGPGHPGRHDRGGNPRTTRHVLPGLVADPAPPRGGGADHGGGDLLPARGVHPADGQAGADPGDHRVVEVAAGVGDGQGPRRAGGSVPDPAPG